MKNHIVALPELPDSEQERLSELKDQLKYKITSVNVKLGEKIGFDKLLVCYSVYFIRTEKEVRVWSDKIKSTKDGTIKRISIKRDTNVRPGQLLLIIEYCPHEMEYDGLCCICGSDIHSLDTTNSKHLSSSNLHNLSDGQSNNKNSTSSNAEEKLKLPQVICGNQYGQRRVIKMSSSALVKLKSENTSHLLSSRKLALVLDIDHTFLHATRDPQAYQLTKHHLFKDSIHSFVLPGHRSPYYIKIRPGFRNFLLDVCGAFDIHLYTMSMRKYAEEVVRWIENPLTDKHQQHKHKYKSLIQNLVTRDDIKEGSNKKLLSRLFPCDDRMVIIIDDRIDVWPEAVQNVIQIHKYLFWPNVDDFVTNSNRQLGCTQIILQKNIKSIIKNYNKNNQLNSNNTKKEIEKGLKRFITNFFKELGCYKVEIKYEVDIIYIYTHKSPTNDKLRRFSYAIKEALNHSQSSISNNTTLNTKNSYSYINILDGCKISYKINSNELARREGDRVLTCLSNVLLKIHKEYYQQYDDINKNNNKNDKNNKKNKIKKGLNHKISKRAKKKRKNNKNSDKQETDVDDDDTDDINDQNENETDDVDKKEDDTKKEEEKNNLNDNKNKNAQKVDSRKILKLVKKSVFSGFIFVFSGIFPMDANPINIAEWRLALEFGARCVKTLSVNNKEGVTHCIAPKMGTAKTSTAIKLDLELVHPNWLHNSCTHYMRSNPSVYRPQGYEKYNTKKDKKDDNNELNEDDKDIDIDIAPNNVYSNNKLKSILMVKKNTNNNRKRKRNNNEIDNNDLNPKKKHKKSVKFKLIGDKEDEEDEQIDPQIKYLNSLNDLAVTLNIDQDNDNKEDEEEQDQQLEEAQEEQEEEQEEIHNDDNDNGNLDAENDEEYEDDDDFSFEDIGKEIDFAQNHLSNNKIPKNVLNGNNNDWDNGFDVNKFYPSHNKNDNVENKMNEENVKEEEEDKDLNIITTTNNNHSELQQIDDDDIDEIEDVEKFLDQEMELLSD